MEEKIVTILNEMADYLKIFLDAKRIEGCSDVKNSHQKIMG